MKLPLGDLIKKLFFFEYHKKLKKFNENDLNKIINDNISKKKFFEKTEAQAKKLKKDR